MSTLPTNFNGMKNRKPPTPSATTSLMPSSLFTIPLNIPIDYFPMINDMFRMAVIQIVAQLLFATANPSVPFLNMFVQSILFVLIGVAVYWLVFRKLLIVMPTSTTPSTTPLQTNQPANQPPEHVATMPVVVPPVLSSSTGEGRVVVENAATTTTNDGRLSPKHVELDQKPANE